MRDKTVIKLITRKQGYERIISLPTLKLQQSSFYSGMLSCCQDQPLPLPFPFPQEYNKALPHYIDYCHHDDKIKVKINKLKVCFELADYLGDDKFLAVLTQCLIRAWPSCLSVLESLHLGIQQNICLYLPLEFVPIEIRSDNLFMSRWLSRNEGKKILGPYNCVYPTYKPLPRRRRYTSPYDTMFLTGNTMRILLGTYM